MRQHFALCRHLAKELRSFWPTCYGGRSGVNIRKNPATRQRHEKTRKLRVFSCWKLQNGD